MALNIRGFVVNPYIMCQILPFFTQFLNAISLIKIVNFNVRRVFVLQANLILTRQIYLYVHWIYGFELSDKTKIHQVTKETNIWIILLYTLKYLDSNNLLEFWEEEDFPCEFPDKNYLITGWILWLTSAVHCTMYKINCPLYITHCAP